MDNFTGSGEPNITEIVAAAKAVENVNLIAEDPLITSSEVAKGNKTHVIKLATISSSSLFVVIVATIILVMVVVIRQKQKR